MKIAFIGLKGIPAKWGGIEVYVEEIAKRLVQRGHEVTVYCRKWFTENYDTYAGIKIVKTPTIKTRATDALLHGFTSSLHALFKNYDIVHYHGFASYYASIFLKFSEKKLVVTMHGTAWDLPKWGYFASAVIKGANFLGINMANRVTTIAPFLKDFLEKTYHKKVFLTPCGVNIQLKRQPQTIYEYYGLKGNDYILFMGRLDSVKRIDWIINAFRMLPCKDNLKLVIAGDIGPSDGLGYKSYLLKLANSDRRIIFTGFQSDNIKEELLSNCVLFVLPSIVEAMPVVLLEAMSYGRPCLVTNIPAHQWIISDGENGFLTNKDNFNEFVHKLAMIFKMNHSTLENLGEKARNTVKEKFSWDKTVDLFEEIYHKTIME